MLKHESPPPNGWSRLETKLSALEADRAREARTWRAVACALVLACAGVSTWNHEANEHRWTLPPASDDVRGEGASVVAGAQTDGVRFYWLMR